MPHMCCPCSLPRVLLNRECEGTGVLGCGDPKEVVTMVWVGVLIGVFVGVPLGFTACAWLTAGKLEDREYPHLV